MVMESVRGRGGGADRGPSGRGRRSYKSWFAGLISAPVLALALTGASVTFWPDWPAFQTLARVLDSLTLHMAAMGVARVLAFPEVVMFRLPGCVEATGPLDPIFEPVDPARNSLHIYTVFLKFWLKHDFGRAVDRLLARG